MSDSFSESAPPALQFDDVAVTRGGHLVWSEGNFEIPAGGIVAVIGPNGSGKTTLLNAILGLIPLASGRIRVFGARPGAENQAIGYVPQNYASDAGDAIRAFDAVLLGLTGRKWAFGFPSADQRDRVQDALRAVNAEELANRRLSALSGGQRQRVAIAEALVSEPKMLILDEPLASLDLKNQRELVRLIGRLNHELGVTILVVTHDLNSLLSVLTGAIYLLDGHAHFAAMHEVVDESLLSHLYGTRIEVAHTPQGELYMRSV